MSGDAIAPQQITTMVVAAEAKLHSSQAPGSNSHFICAFASSGLSNE